MSIIYILSNEYMPDVLKIGITNNLKQRMQSLNTTGIPVPFTCEYAVELSDRSKVEKAEKHIHNGLSSARVHRKREFFEISLDEAISILKIVEVMGGKNVTPQNEDEMIEDVQDKEALNKVRQKQSRINYFEDLGINVGTELHFKGDKSITCRVAEDSRNVEFRGEIMSLSKSAMIVLSESGFEWKSAWGAMYWCLDNQSLVNLKSKSQNEIKHNSKDAA